jgi:hypothetical protein
VSITININYSITYYILNRVFRKIWSKLDLSMFSETSSLKYIYLFTFHSDLTPLDAYRIYLCKIKQI